MPEFITPVVVQSPSDRVHCEVKKYRVPWKTGAPPARGIAQVHGYDRGHLLAEVLGGSGEAQNIIYMNPGLNRHQYQKLETALLCTTGWQSNVPEDLITQVLKEFNDDPNMHPKMLKEDLRRGCPVSMDMSWVLSDCLCSIRQPGFFQKIDQTITFNDDYDQAERKNKNTPEQYAHLLKMFLHKLLAMSGPTWNGSKTVTVTFQNPPPYHGVTCA